MLESIQEKINQIVAKSTMPENTGVFKYLKDFTYEDYKKSVLKFWNDWKDCPNPHALDYKDFFTTNEAGEYEESCDNSNGGLDVSWAFGKTKNYVERYYMDYFDDEINSLYECIIEEDE